MSDERKSRPSASSFELYDACNGAYQLQLQVPESERFSNEASEAGVRIHAASEHSDLGMLEEISEKDLLERIRERERDIFLDWAGQNEITDAVHEREKRLWYSDGGYDYFSGQLDYFSTSRTRNCALILDTKSGRIAATPSPKNLQLRAQAVLLAFHTGVNKVRVGIVQPFAPANPVCDYTFADLQGAAEQLLELIEDIDRPNAPRTPGAHCARCPAKHICPEAREMVTSVAKLQGLKWATLAPATKLELWDKAKIAAKICEAIEQNIKAELAANPKAIPGLDKQPDGTSRKIADAIITHSVLWSEATALGVPIEDFNAKFNSFCEVSIGGIEEWYRELNPKATQKSAKEWVNKTLAAQITTVPRAGRILRLKEKN